MAIIIPKRGYLTFAELRQRWQCTDNDLRYLVVNGELKPSIKAMEPLEVVTVKSSLVDGSEQLEVAFNECEYKFLPSWTLFLLNPRRRRSLDCSFHFVAGAGATDFQDLLSFSAQDPVWERAWFRLPNAITMSDIENEHAFFAMDEVLRYEDAHDQDAPPKLEEKPMATRERWPWGSHHTEALGHLEAAAKQWWVNHDPGEIDTAPRNAEVIEWLVNERSTSRAMATSIASILRLDGLPTGPRK